MTVQSESPPQARSGPLTDSDPVVLVLTIGFILLFVGASIFDSSYVADLIGSGFAWTATYLGSFFQLLLLLTFFIAIGTALSRAGAARIGGLDRPEIGRFRWLSMIMCTLLAGGGVFFAAGEPVYHFVVTPPAFNTEAGSAAAVAPAMAQSFTHWGFLAWAVLGSLTALVLTRAHYGQGKPLQPRTLLYPVFGEKVIQGRVGGVIDAFCVIAVVAGTVGPIGFLATQMSFGLHELFGVSDGYGTQLTVLVVLAGVYMTSAMTGLHKGIQLLSRFNVILALVIAGVIFVFGPTLFLANTYTQSMGEYVSSFFAMATMTAETAPAWWMKWWTVFFFACMTDYWDGLIARYQRKTTKLGILLDPIADKAMVMIALLALGVWSPLAHWIALPAGIILFREVFVSGLREFLGNVAGTLKVTKLAKWKTAVQMVAVALLLAQGAFNANLGMSVFGMDGETVSAILSGEEEDPLDIRGKMVRAEWGGIVGVGLLWIAAGLTAVTGWDYFQKARAHLGEE